MPRPLPVTTATLPSRFIAPTLMSERNRPLRELDLHVFAARLIPGLPVDRVRDRVGCICEEHGALDAGPLEREGGHLVREPPRVAVVAMLRRRVHRTDSHDAGGARPAPPPPDLPAPLRELPTSRLHHVIGDRTRVRRSDVLDLGAEIV